MPTLVKALNATHKPVLADLQPLGDGTFKAKPRPPGIDSLTWLTPLEVGRLLKVSRSFVYVRLLDESIPMLVTRRPAKGKILISAKSLDDYRRAARNPSFAQNGVVRNRHIAAVRTAHINPRDEAL